MHFVPDLYPSEIQPLLARFMPICSWAAWTRRLQGFESQLRELPTVGEYIYERHALELALLDLVRHKRLTGRLPWPPDSEGRAAIYGFISMVCRAHQRLTTQGKKRLAGMLKSGLDSDFGLIPLEHEMSTAASLMHHNFDVEFSDIEGRAQFDFLASRDGATMEVECKNFSADLGRQVRRRQVYLLTQQLLRPLEHFLKARPGGHLIKILLPGKLYGERQFLTHIANLANDCLTQQTRYSDRGVDVSYESFEINGSVFDSRSGRAFSVEAAKAFVEDQFGIENQTCLFHVRPQSGAVVVAVQSRKPDLVLSALESSLKDSVKRQLSGKHPAALCVRFSDLTESQLKEIAERDLSRTVPPSGLQVVISNLLRRRDWRNVHTVRFAVPGRLVHARELSGAGWENYRSQRGGCYTFRNPTHPLKDDKR